MPKWIVLAFFFISQFTVLGASNQAVRFYDNYAIFPSSPLLRITDQITVECWIKAEKYYAWAAPVSHIVDNECDESGYAMILSDDKVRFMIKTDKMRCNDWTYNPGVEIAMNQWQHIAGVYDGKSIKFYENGILIDERYVSGKIDWEFKPDQLCIGAFMDNNELQHFYGCIDEVRIWNRSLTTKEIKERMDRELSGDEEGLIVYFPMTEDGSVIKDYSKNRLDGKIVNYTSESRVPSLAMVRPVISNSELLSTSSYKLEWTVPNQTEAFEVFYVDLARDSKFKSMLPGFENLKTVDNNFTFENIAGGENLYARIKGRSKNGEYSAFSDPFLINEFSTSLTIDLLSKGAKINNHFIILDDNILSTKSFKFQKGTRSIVIEATLASKQGQDAYATMHIKGGGMDETYLINRMSKLILPDVKPGKYEVSLSWGPDSNGKLENSFVIEIDKFWWQNIWFQIVVLAILSIILFLLLRRFTILKRKKYLALLDGYVPVPEKDEIISDEEMTKHYNELIELMNSERPYLKPRLTLKHYENMLDIQSNILSRILHEKCGLYFNDFVNKYRIEEAKRYLKSKDASNLKITAVAYRCGFNSESTFFRVFKKFTGETPTSYQNRLRKR